MSGRCACGCGAETAVVVWTDRSRSLTKGQHRRWLNGHQNRAPLWTLVRVDLETGCWTWSGVRSQGYGVVTRDGKHHLAHRLFFEGRHGSLTTDLDHLCRNRACVNPDHLERITRGENVRRGDVAKLDWDKVAEIRDQAKGLPGSQRQKSKHLAPLYGVAAGTIRNVLMETRWPPADDPRLLEAA